jgi:hypothetical protein
LREKDEERSKPTRQPWRVKQNRNLSFEPEMEGDKKKKKGRRRREGFIEEELQR